MCTWLDKLLVGDSMAFHTIHWRLLTYLIVCFITYCSCFCSFTVTLSTDLLLLLALILLMFTCYLSGILSSSGRQVYYKQPWISMCMWDISFMWFLTFMFRTQVFSIWRHNMEPWNMETEQSEPIEHYRKRNQHSIAGPNWVLNTQPWLTHLQKLIVWISLLYRWDRSRLLCIGDDAFRWRSIWW